MAAAVSKKPPQNKAKAGGNPPVGHRFRKGQSGNPGGRPKVVAEVRELARQHTTLAIETLAKIAKEADRDAARVAAANSLLDRGWGRPLTEIEVKLALLKELESRTDSQLERLAGIVQQPQQDQTVKCACGWERITRVDGSRTLMSPLFAPNGAAACGDCLRFAKSEKA